MTLQSDSSKCKHATCECTVEPSLAYCCEYCARADQEEAAVQQRLACDCRHPECSSPRPRE